MITITRRALNMASLLCRDAWHEDRHLTGRGIVSWLESLAEAAATKGAIVDGNVTYGGVRFHFTRDLDGLALLSVRPAKIKLDSEIQHEAKSSHADTSTTK